MNPSEENPEFGARTLKLNAEGIQALRKGVLSSLAMRGRGTMTLLLSQLENIYMGTRLGSFSQLRPQPRHLDSSCEK